VRVAADESDRHSEIAAGSVTSLGRIWPRRSPWGTVAVTAIVLVSVLPSLVGFLRAPTGWSFTGATAYADDLAQHELWASEMARHGRYLVNLMTPEVTASGWFSNPLEIVLGLLQRGTGAPYQVLSALLAVAAIPALAWGLLKLARSAELSRPAIAVLLALLAGSLAPLGVAFGKLGLPGDNPVWLSYGGAATPIFAGTWLELTPAVLTIVVLSRPEVVTGFRRAGVILCVLGFVYPFFVPVLWLTGALYAALVVRKEGRRKILLGLAWFTALPILPAAYYAVVLPHVDSEFARFERLNHQPVPALATTVVSLGVGGAALLGVPRLIRGNRVQVLLGCFAFAFIIALYIPQHPWRSHLFSLSPLLVLGALAAWWPVIRRWGWKPGLLVMAAVLAATLPSVPYYYAKQIRGVLRVEQPQYLTSGDVAAMKWLRGRFGDSVVLARRDISPWVAVRSGHRVLVGDYLWTHGWSTRRRQVDAVFEGGSPCAMLTAFHVRVILLDTERGVPSWARGVQPIARFHATTLLPAAEVIGRSCEGRGA
jgi:hypothetical protein